MLRGLELEARRVGDLGACHKQFLEIFLDKKSDISKLPGGVSMLH